MRECDVVALVISFYVQRVVPGSLRSWEHTMWLRTEEDTHTDTHARTHTLPQRLMECVVIDQSEQVESDLDHCRQISVWQEWQYGHQYLTRKRQPLYTAPYKLGAASGQYKLLHNSQCTTLNYHNTHIHNHCSAVWLYNGQKLNMVLWRMHFETRRHRNIVCIGIHRSAWR